MQQLKDIVLKNLAKDPIYYTKDGQFGVKGLGYTTEAPGLGTPKEPKGKYASSGYGNLNESQINEITEKDIQSMDELDLKVKLNSLGVTPTAVNSTLSTKGIEGLKDRLRDKLKDRAIGFKESKEIDSFISNVKKAFSEKPDKKFTPEEIEAKLNQLYPGRAERKKNDSPEESKLREVIREMIDAELGEAYQMMNVNPGKSEGGDIFIPQFYILPPEARKKLNLLNPGENAPTYREEFQIPHLRALPGNTIVFSNWLVQAIENPKDVRNPLTGILNSLNRSNENFRNFLTYVKKFISTNKVVIPTRGKDAIYYELLFPEGFEVSPLKEWVEKKLEESYTKLEKAKSGEVRRGRPVNIEGLKRFIKRLEELSQNPEGGMVVALPSRFGEAAIGVRDTDVEPAYISNLPISYSDDKNVAHYSDDYRYSGQDDLLDPEDYFEQIQGMSDGDAFNYLEELGLERDEILTVLKRRKSSLREGVEKDLADINKEAEHEVLQSKLDKIDALIDHRRSKLTKLDEDEDMKALTDKKKVKELEKDIKKLEQARTKVEKMLGKTKGKKKEVIDETDDDMMDENMPLDDNMMGEEMSYEENY